MVRAARAKGGRRRPLSVLRGISRAAALITGAICIPSKAASWRYRRSAVFLHAEGYRPDLPAHLIDPYANTAFAKLYDRKTPITAAEILNDRVVPFYDEYGTRLCGPQERRR